MTRRIVRAPHIHPPLARYHHAVTCEGWLFTSGVLGIARDGAVPDGIEEQCSLCFDNLKSILEEAQMTFDHVVRFNAFVTDRAFFDAYGRVRARYAPGGNFASTLVIVSGFTRPEFKVEVEATAWRGAGV
jgi:enamine deaminase RidA (YjgF/YER057c/UK114 family)